MKVESSKPRTGKFMIPDSPATTTGAEKPSTNWRQILLLAFILHPSSFILSGCSRAPQTAAELQKQLPPQYQGELRLQGETEAHRMVIEPHNFNVRDPHHLEFNQVRYQFFTGNSVTAQGEANIRGVISTPDLAIRIDEITGAEGSSDAVKAGSFQGSLSKDLREVDAAWLTGFGQGAKLKAKATP